MNKLINFVKTVLFLDTIFCIFLVFNFTYFYFTRRIEQGPNSVARYAGLIVVVLFLVFAFLDFNLAKRWEYLRQSLSKSILTSLFGYFILFVSSLIITLSILNFIGISIAEGQEGVVGIPLMIVEGLLLLVTIISLVKQKMTKQV